LKSNETLARLIAPAVYEKPAGQKERRARNRR
jgi:hypothetical protein